MRSTRGISAIEILVTVAILAMAVAVAAPAMEALRVNGRAAAGARQMASLFQALRWQSTTGHRGRGLLFERDSLGWYWTRVEDGNGNGLRTHEVRRGVDRVLSGPRRLESMVEHVTLGFPPGGPFPRIPPRRGTISDTEDPVQFGRSNLVSFRPTGDASSGTLYVTDRRNALFGVVLFGPTCRIRVWRYDTRTERWRR